MLSSVLPRNGVTAYHIKDTDCTAFEALRPASALQVWLVMGDCFFIGLAPVLVHMAKNAQGKYSFHPVAVNLLVECTKLTFATAVLVANVRRFQAHSYAARARIRLVWCQKS